MASKTGNQWYGPHGRTLEILKGIGAELLDINFKIPLKKQDLSACHCDGQCNGRQVRLTY
jgi:hypothetical protein